MLLPSNMVVLLLITLCSLRGRENGKLQLNLVSSSSLSSDTTVMNTLMVKSKMQSIYFLVTFNHRKGNLLFGS
uniref:Uncharacterized protein n=1 Tax=Salix viminalis TaxID=40686 RepID=A0A6N2LS20_SALVM